MANVKLTINGIAVSVPSGTTILDAAKSAGVRIPTLCAYEGMGPHAEYGACFGSDESGTLLRRLYDGEPVPGDPLALAVGTAMAKMRHRCRLVVVSDGVEKVKDFALVPKEGLGNAVPEHYAVVTPDGARIEPLLSAVFGHHYKGSMTPLAERLAEVAVARGDLLVDEPLPIYLQPPVK